MVKPKQQASPQSPEAVEEDHSRTHPLLRGESQVEQLLKAAQARKDEREFKIEELQVWKDCINSLAATPNGRMLFKSLLQHSGIFDPPNLANPQRMVTNTIKASFYLSWVRPYLQPELRKELEP